MRSAIQPISDNWRKLAIFLVFGLGSLFFSRAIASELYGYLFLLLFIGGVTLLFLKQMELFILLILLLNHELFYLLSNEVLGGRNFQGLVYVALFATGLWYFLRDKKPNDGNFNFVAIALLFIGLMAVFNSFFHGQPLLLGIKAAKGYFLILFYFVFMARPIDTQKLFKLIIISGVILTFLNNVQYLFFGKIRIFHFFREMERAGQLRFLIGDFFAIFAPIIAFGEYLKNKKKIYLFASLYMVITMTLQGQTRAVMWGSLVTLFLLLYLAKKINYMKVVIYGVPLLVILIWIIPLIQSTFLGELYELTKHEITRREGNVAIRFDAYNYYLGEIFQSPLIGRGIWSEAFDIYMGDNPEDMTEQGLYLSDIGITSLIFHAGLIGALWLVWLLVKVYKRVFISRRQIKEEIPYGLVGYFIFGLSTILTLNCFLHHRTIIYLALALALLTQSESFNQENQTT